MKSPSITVVGAGTMGAGIAQVAALHGFSVSLFDIEDDLVHRALERIRASLHKGVQLGKVSAADADQALARIRAAAALEDCAAARVVVEAAPEDLHLKRDLFRRLDALAPPDCLLASNTSSLSITAIGGATTRPERVVGVHFFNPPHLMQLVEIVRGEATSPETVEAAVRLARDLGKTPVVCQDTPAFIVNRVARPFYGEALRLLGENAAEVSTIDRLMRSLGFRMGPFELMDLIGVDVNYAVSESVYHAFFEDPRYRPHPIQRRMVEAGRLGRKSGQGFYKYP